MWGWQFANLKKEKPLRCGLDIGVGVQLKKGKGKFLYSAVSNPQDCSKRFTLYFLGRPVQSDTITTYLGNIQPYAAINARKLLVYIYTTCLMSGTHLYS